MTKNEIQPAKKIIVHLEVDSSSICLHYQIDKKYKGELIADIPISTNNIRKNLIDFYGFLGSIFLAQLCLASEVEITTPIPSALLSIIEPVIRNLYAVRSYRDKLEIGLSPLFTIKTPNITWDPYIINPNKKAVTAWSGGLDSTLSHVLLLENNYEIFPLHISNANVDAAQSELRAIKELSNILNCTCPRINLTFPQYFDIAMNYSNNAREYPDVNSVPHGRELLLLPLSLIYAFQVNASNICFGFEHSTWTEQFSLNGEKFSRFDTQSQSSFVIFQQAVKKFISQNITLFSPIAAITEYRKFLMIVTKYPELAQNSSFCYWGNSCGLCRKCSLYYIFQRSLGENVIAFQNNPILAQTTFIRQSILNWNNPDSRDSNYALARIIETQNIFDGEELLTEYKQNVYPKVQPLLNEWQKELMSLHQVELLPKGFHFG